MLPTPCCYSVGQEFPIVGDEDLEVFTTLVFNYAMPKLECISGITLSSEGDCPGIT